MTAVRLLRRVHLFAGLSLLPWVVLYGATAFLFNHPDAWRTRDSPRDLGTIDGPRVPTGGDWPAAVVRAMGPRARLESVDSARVYAGVSLRVAISDTSYDAFYDATTGKVTARLADGPTVGLLRFFTELHTTRGYGTGLVRGIWAVAVDAIATLMLFWAVSGLFMWWQIRTLRTVGGLVLVLSSVAAIALGLGLRHALAQR